MALNESKLLCYHVSVMMRDMSVDFNVSNCYLIDSS